MPSSPSPAEALAQRMCRPQRVGVFGQRGVGKTTLLTMLYREAVGGRLPGLRLAAADARTAEYLADKVLQLEAGRPLPATLAETELRFHLYCHDVRVELLVKDYQGEHVALGRREPIREFLLDCDAIWICLDVPTAAQAATQLQAQQEVEQLVEDYLSTTSPHVPHRPMGLLVTKADLLTRSTGPALPDAMPLPRHALALSTSLDQPSSLGDMVHREFAMTRHTLRMHCPQHALFAVSSLGGPLHEGSAPRELVPTGLREPLAWLATALQAQDESRLASLWANANGNLRLRGQVLEAFRRRYPAAPLGAEYTVQLQQLQRQRRRRYGLSALIAAACLILAVGTYDAVGEQRVERFAQQHREDPRGVRDALLAYQRWHPSRHVFRPAAAQAEQQRLAELDAGVRQQQRTEQLGDLRRLAADPDADPELVWQQFQAFRSAFPEHSVDEEMAQFRSLLKTRRDAQREHRSRDAFAELQRLEREGDLTVLVQRADRFLRDFDGTKAAADVSHRRTMYLLRLDERDIDEARSYSASNPLNFQTRREHYQRYLQCHPEGAFAKEAREALAAVDLDWDRHDFRQVRDHFQERPGDVKELQKLARRYLAVHPTGRFAAAARDLLRWTERVTEPANYRVVLHSGSFEKSVATWLSRGPSLSVELEVGGVRYGPSSIVPRSYAPIWDYEFPRRIRWKLGDPVRIFVTDHYYWDRSVLQLGSEEGDALGLRLLCGEVQTGRNVLTFESDFHMPVMPKIE